MILSLCVLFPIATLCFSVSVSPAALPVFCSLSSLILLTPSLFLVLFLSLCFFLAYSVFLQYLLFFSCLSSLPFLFISLSSSSSASISVFVLPDACHSEERYSLQAERCSLSCLAEPRVPGTHEQKYCSCSDCIARLELMSGLLVR